MRRSALIAVLCTGLLVLAAACGWLAGDPGAPGEDPNASAQVEDPADADDRAIPLAPAPGDPTPVGESGDGVLLVDVTRTAVTVYRNAAGELVTDDVPQPNSLSLGDEPLALPADLAELPWTGLDFFYPFVILRDDGADPANGEPASQLFWQVYDWEEGAFVLTRDQLDAPLADLAGEDAVAPRVRHLWLPSYDPDRAQLAFTAQICPPDGAAVCDGLVGFTVLATGETHFTRVLELSPARRLAWSPDGTRLAYAVDWSMMAVVHRPPAELPLGVYVDSVTDRQAELSAGHDFEDYWSVAGLVWSPDGGEVRLALLSDPAGNWVWHEGTQSYRPEEDPVSWVLDPATGELRPAD